MKAEIKLSADIKEPYAVIYTSAVTEEVQCAVKIFEAERTTIGAKDNEKTVIPDPEKFTWYGRKKEKFSYRGGIKKIPPASCTLRCGYAILLK